jgi:hypothetical protein
MQDKKKEKMTVRNLDFRKHKRWDSKMPGVEEAGCGRDRGRAVSGPPYAVVGRGGARGVGTGRVGP